jgi:hypothetical protein
MILLVIYFFFSFNGHIAVSLLVSYSIKFVQCKFSESVSFDGHILLAGRGLAVHAAELLVLESSLFEVGTAVEELKIYKLPGMDHIPTELVKSKR